MPTGSFSADAWILAADRWRHHRLRDHFGADSDLYIMLSENIGKYIAYTPVHWVLEDMIARITALETGRKSWSSFTADAWIATSGSYEAGIFTADAVVQGSRSGSFTANAYIIRGGSFTADAIIMPSFTADAFIVLAT
jgi:hypothetical protein